MRKPSNFFDIGARGASLSWGCIIIDSSISASTSALAIQSWFDTGVHHGRQKTLARYQELPCPVWGWRLVRVASYVGFAWADHSHLKQLQTIGTSRPAMLLRELGQECPQPSSLCWVEDNLSYAPAKCKIRATSLVEKKKWETPNKIQESWHAQQTPTLNNERSV